MVKCELKKLYIGTHLLTHQYTHSLTYLLTHSLTPSIYTRFYDSKVNKYYWLNGKTNATTWKASKWLIRQNVPMPPEDVMLYEATMKIRELELKLLEKEKEIITVRYLLTYLLTYSLIDVLTYSLT